MKRKQPTAGVSLVPASIFHEETHVRQFAKGNVARAGTAGANLNNVEAFRRERDLADVSELSESELSDVTTAADSNAVMSSPMYDPGMASGDYNVSRTDVWRQ